MLAKLTIRVNGFKNNEVEAQIIIFPETNIYFKIFESSTVSIFSAGFIMEYPLYFPQKTVANPFLNNRRQRVATSKISFWVAPKFLGALVLLTRSTVLIIRCFLRKFFSNDFAVAVQVPPRVCPEPHRPKF